MHDSQEPSYYEIALTNRQVLVFFVVLLLSVVGAFFSGVWLGQQRAGELPTIAQVPATEPQEEGEETLAELNFFTDEPPAPATAKPSQSKPARTTRKKPEEVAPSGSPETTLLEDLNGSQASTGATAPPAEPPAASQPPPATAGDLVIQVFSSPDAAQARKLLDRLSAGGYQAFISPVEVDGRTMHRVRIGPFVERGEAEEVAGRVEKAYQVDTWITRNE